VLGEFMLTECARKKASLVLAAVEIDDKSAAQLRFLKYHGDPHFIL
jgi:hypothetical protein